MAHWVRWTNTITEITNQLFSVWFNKTDILDPLEQLEYGCETVWMQRLVARGKMICRNTSKNSFTGCRVGAKLFTKFAQSLPVDIEEEEP